MFNLYNQQPTLDRINAQINELEKMKNQMQQPIQAPTSSTQNFQLTPTNREVIRYADSIEEVQRDMVVGDTPYFSKDLSVVWIKNPKNEIKTYELTEIIPKDEKDIQISWLQAQINELKGMINNEQSNTDVNATEIETNSTRDDEQPRVTIKESKPTSVSRVSERKKK